jgi:hypothetical protein
MFYGRHDSDCHSACLGQDGGNESAVIAGNLSFGILDIGSESCPLLHTAYAWLSNIFCSGKFTGNGSLRKSLLKRNKYLPSSIV